MLNGRPLEANAVIQTDTDDSGVDTAASDCQLRNNGTDFIGGAADQRSFEQKYLATLPLNGGVAIASGSATVGVWCRDSGIGSSGIFVTFHGPAVASPQIMAVQIGRLF
jgi:hypothetical protein